MERLMTTLTEPQRLAATKHLLERMGWTDLEVKDFGHGNRLYGSSPVKETTELFEKATGRSVEPFQWDNQVAPDPFTSADAFDSVKKAMTEGEQRRYLRLLWDTFIKTLDPRVADAMEVVDLYTRFDLWLEFDCPLSLKAEIAARAMGYGREG